MELTVTRSVLPRRGGAAAAVCQRLPRRRADCPHSSVELPLLRDHLDPRRSLLTPELILNRDPVNPYIVDRHLVYLQNPQHVVFLLDRDSG